MAGAQNQQDRVPPQDIGAEQSVLGSVLIDKEAFFRVADALKPDDFYSPQHRVVFSTMIDLAEKNRPIDILTVSGRLKENKKLEEIGGHAYLTKLVNSVPTASNVTYYADMVRRKAILRRLIESSYHIAQLGYQEDQDVNVLLDQAEQHVFSIAENSSQSFYRLDKSALEEAFERIDHLSKNKGEVRGVPTGFADLDHMLSGFQKSDLIILAARPSLGKSSLALDIARNVATKHKVPVGIFSLEMSQDQIIDRMISATAHVDLWKIRTGKKLEDNDFTRIQDALNTLSEAPVFIDDGLTSSILQMRAMARRLQAEHGLGLLIVDYLQLIQPRRDSDSTVQQVSEISRALKAIARELNIPVLALSQLSRAVEQRGGRPRLSDLRDSGSIEQDADVVMFIHRDTQNHDDPMAGNIAELIVAKHRNGPTGKVDLIFNSTWASFGDAERYRETPTEFANNFANDQMPDVGLDDIPS
jgi:replicative DNA helicase